MGSWPFSGKKKNIKSSTEYPFAKLSTLLLNVIVDAHSLMAIEKVKKIEAYFAYYCPLIPLTLMNSLRVKSFSLNFKIIHI